MQLYTSVMRLLLICFVFIFFTLYTYKIIFMGSIRGDRG